MTNPPFPGSFQSSGPQEPPTTRAYRSEHRRAQAAATRRQVLESATALFVERGYGLVTMRDIAERAGVSVETVYAQGSKTALLLTCVDRALAGDDDDVALADRPAAVAALGAASQETMLVGFLGFLVEVAQRAGGVIVAYENAAAADAAVAREWELAEHRRWLDYRRFVEALAGAGGLAPGYDVESATQALWVTHTPRNAHMLLGTFAWSPDQVLAWAVATVRVILPQEREDTHG